MVRFDAFSSKPPPSSQDGAETRTVHEATLEWYADTLGTQRKAYGPVEAAARSGYHRHYLGKLE